MRALISFVSWLLVLIPVVVIAAILVLVQPEPAVQRPTEFTTEHVARARQVFARHDPRRRAGASVRTLTLTPEELDLLANLAARRFGEASVEVELGDDEVAFAATIELPDNPLGRFLNLHGRLHAGPEGMVPDQVFVGGLRIPDWLTLEVFKRGLASLQAREDGQALAGAVRGIAVSPAGLSVEYKWDQDLAERIRNSAVPALERERLKVYQERLAAVLGSGGRGERPLVAVLQPLMQTASERSREEDAVAENRALLTVLAFHVSGRSLVNLVPDARQWRTPARLTLTLSGRRDFAQHFAISAAMAALGGGAAADVVGLYKEVGDARGGSGFSFQDMAINRAGTRFGERAAASSRNARRVQDRFAGGVSERDLVPSVSDLPEFMREAEFRRRFGGVGSEPYERTMIEIERRLAACCVLTD